jgi:hypothetical protein
MPGSDRWFERPDDELRDDEFPDEDDSDDGSSETVACPECGAEVYEDAVQCPVCGNYIMHQAGIWSGRPAWWIILALLGVLATVLVLTCSPW